jgi:hypothetical protein
MSSPWFITPNNIDSEEVISLKRYFENPFDQRDVLKMCIDISKMAVALTESTRKPKVIDIDSVGLRGGTLVVVSDLGKEPTQKSLSALAKVANEISSRLDSPYRPQATQDLESFERFGQRAVSLFRTF